MGEPAAPDDLPGNSGISRGGSSDQGFVLEMRGIDKRFPGVHALKRVDLRLKRGEILALVGENGAGKSTLMKVLTGIYTPDEGEIVYNGSRVAFSSPREAQAAGISIVHQELNLMNHLSVARNIFIGRESKGFFLNDKIINEAAAGLFERLHVAIDPREKVGRLTVGKQQMVEIAKAMSFDSGVIVFDEPTGALSASETRELFGIMREFRGRGISMIFITHRMDEIKEISDRITVMRDGEYVDTFVTEDTGLDAIIRAMVGRVIYEEPKTVSGVPADAPVVLDVRNLSSRQVKDVSFKLRKGEILGFAGLIGAGRTEAMRLIFGADRRDGGEIFIGGRPVNIKTPRDAVSNGIGYLSEDRKRFGLALGLSVADNAVMTALREYCRGWFVNRPKITAAVSDYVNRINIRTPSVFQPVGKLSGGNQQKVVVAKWLIRNCDILIFDEPTRGIDVGAKSEIYKLMNSLAEQGKSIIMVSSEMPEIFRMSDRIACMCEGRLTGILNIEEASQEAVMKYATMRG